MVATSTSARPVPPRSSSPSTSPASTTPRSGPSPTTASAAATAPSSAASSPRSAASPRHHVDEPFRERLRHQEEVPHHDDQIEDHPHHPVRPPPPVRRAILPRLHQPPDHEPRRRPRHLRQHLPARHP